MKVILTETIDSLGLVGTEVTVANGYARNYLLPQKMAVPATDANRKMLAHKRIKWEKKIAEERKLAEQIAERVADVTVTISAKVSGEDRLYGSVSVRDIANALAEQGMEVEKGSILLEEPIKSLGTYTVPIRLFHDVEPSITVEVVPEEA